VTPARGGIRRALLRAEPGGERFLAFDDPLESLATHSVAEVPALLAAAEVAAARGLWAVGFVGYEAAPAFDAALVAHRPSGPAPLAAFSFFASPREVTGPLARSTDDAAGIESSEPGRSTESHGAAVDAIRAAIAAGATYQVNFSFPFTGRFRGQPEALFAALLAPGEAPYAALLAGDGWAVVSLSPELFFEREGRGSGPARVTMRPMKGTRPRGRFGDEDRALAEELFASPKDRAENLMIVDMVRNDLGRVARAGSVEVERRFEVERYPTVWQMTSTVAAESDAALPELFAALYPCASVTGAPKPATMRLIRELEATPRGAYCGAIGFVAPAGRARFSVAIRTLELDLERSSYRYGVGGGVTWDSDPAAEWQECLAKARVLDGAPAEFELLETMRFRPGCGIALLDLHLERLADSADFFGFERRKAFIEGKIKANVLARCAELPHRSHRVRLRMARDGGVAIDVEPFDKERRAWSVAVAAEPIPSMEVFVFHKTTERGFFDRAAAAHPGVDELLLVNERGELTQGTRTNLFVQISGEWLTPPLDAGLLPGVFRAHLLRTGKAIEATLYPRDLERAHRIRLGNALRGWIPVTR
jgi:para-aminobenzoate synthetase/4-amino-4-deoxychorismate lyase